MPCVFYMKLLFRADERLQILSFLLNSIASSSATPSRRQEKTVLTGLFGALSNGKLSQRYFCCVVVGCVQTYSIVC